MASGLFPLSLLWLLDPGKLIYCHLVYCFCYLRWSVLSWASVHIWVPPPPPHPHGPDGGPSPAGTLKEHSLWSSVVYKCRRGITLSVWKKKSNSGNSFRKWFTFLLRQVSDVQRQWKLYNLVSLRKLEKKRFSNEHLNCHANEPGLIIHTSKCVLVFWGRVSITYFHSWLINSTRHWRLFW